MGPFSQAALWPKWADDGNPFLYTDNVRETSSSQPFTGFLHRLQAVSDQMLL